MGKIIKKGALTNFVLVTIFEHEYESIEEIAVIYIKYDNLIDFIDQLKKVIYELENISHNLKEDSITILTTMDTYIFKLLECTIDIYQLDEEKLEIKEENKIKISFFSSKSI